MQRSSEPRLKTGSVSVKAAGCGCCELAAETTHAASHGLPFVSHNPSSSYPPWKCCHSQGVKPHCQRQSQSNIQCRPHKTCFFLVCMRRVVCVLPGCGRVVVVTSPPMKIAFSTTDHTESALTALVLGKYKLQQPLQGCQCSDTNLGRDREPTRSDGWAVQHGVRSTGVQQSSHAPQELLRVPHVTVCRSYLQISSRRTQSRLARWCPQVSATTQPHTGQC